MADLGDIEEEYRYKLDNYMKVYQQIDALEKRIANHKPWDPRDDHWTNWDPDATEEARDRKMLKNLKA